MKLLLRKKELLKKELLKKVRISFIDNVSRADSPALICMLKIIIWNIDLPLLNIQKTMQLFCLPAAMEQAVCPGGQETLPAYIFNAGICDILYGYLCGLESIEFASSSFLNRSFTGSQYNFRGNFIAI